MTSVVPWAPAGLEPDEATELVGTLTALLPEIQKALAADLGITIGADGEVPWPPGFALDWDAVYAARPAPGTVTWW